MMLAAHLDVPAGPVVDAMRERRVLTCPAGPSAVRFLPPFNVAEEEVDEIVAAFGSVL